MNRRHVVIAALSAAASSVLYGHAARADLPLVAGNFQIAQEFLHGDAHVIILGDSEQNRLTGLYPSTWKVDRWSGIVASDQMVASQGDLGTYPFGFSAPFIASEQDDSSDTTDPAAEGGAPGGMRSITFASQTAPAGADPQSNRIFELDLEPNQENIFNGGAWDDIPNGTMHADAIVYANPTGLASGLQFDVHTDTDTELASATFSAQSSAGGLLDIPLSFSSNGLDSTHVTASFRMLPGTTPTDGSNLVVAGTRFYNGQPGFQMSDIHQGGQGIAHFLNGVDEHLDQFIQMTDSNLAYIWLGQNDTSLYTPAEYQQKMETLIADYKQINPNMKFVLVAPYDTGSPTLAAFAQDFYNISQTDSSVLFLNMYEAAGSFSYLNANYLQDTVHPNTAGAVYFANLSQTLLADADSMAIKLPGDVNLDGTVDSQDFDTLATYYGNTDAYLAIGDLNGDGTVNALDFNLLATNYGKTLSDFEPQPATTIVPEPSFATMLFSIIFTASISRRVRFLVD